MKLPFALGATGLGGLLGLGYYASAAGLWATQPQKKPMSVREYSQRHGAGFTGTRRSYVGGGIHYGK